MNPRHKYMIVIGIAIQILIAYAIYASLPMRSMSGAKRLLRVTSSDDGDETSSDDGDETSSGDEDVTSSGDGDASGATTKVIPKLLHQVFSSSNVYERYKPMIESCLRLNPDWKYYLWTKADADILINQYYPKLSDSIKLMPTRLEVSDTTRYAVLHKFGGVYLDMDIECRKPLWPAVANLSAFTAQEPRLHAQIIHDVPFLATNAALGSTPGHPFFGQIIARLESKDSVPFGKVIDSTGPLMLTDQMTKYWRHGANRRYPLALMLSHVFMPLVDEAFEWRKTCTDNMSASQDSARTKGCLRLKSLNWIIPKKFRPQTIGIHHWIHLGWSSGELFPRFNILKEFSPRIHSYAANFKIDV